MHSFDNLTPDIKRHISSYLDNKSLLNFKQTSKSNSAPANDEIFERKIIECLQIFATIQLDQLMFEFGFDFDLQAWAKEFSICLLSTTPVVKYHLLHGKKNRLECDTQGGVVITARSLFLDADLSIQHEGDSPALSWQMKNPQKVDNSRHCLQLRFDEIVMAPGKRTLDVACGLSILHAELTALNRNNSFTLMDLNAHDESAESLRQVVKVYVKNMVFLYTLLKLNSTLTLQELGLKSDDAALIQKIIENLKDIVGIYLDRNRIFANNNNILKKSNQYTNHFELITCVWLFSYFNADQVQQALTNMADYATIGGEIRFYAGVVRGFGVKQNKIEDIINKANESLSNKQLVLDLSNSVSYFFSLKVKSKNLISRFLKF